MSDITIKQKIEAACAISGITVTELGKRMGYSQSAFSQKLKRGKFSQEDLESFANVLGAKYYSGFLFPNGSRVE